MNEAAPLTCSRCECQTVGVYPSKGSKRCQRLQCSEWVLGRPSVFEALRRLFGRA